MMAEISTDIYRNQPNPLGTLSNVYNIENAAQELRLRQQSEQIRNFELQDKRNQAINGVLGPLQTVPGLDLKGAQSIVLPQMRALGIDPYSHPRTAPLFTGELDNKEKFDNYLKGNAAPFLGAGAFQPVTGPAAPSGAPTTVLPSQRAAMPPVPQITGLPPSEEARQRTGVTQGLTAKNLDLTASGNWQARYQTQSKIIELLVKGGPRMTGLGTDEINNLKNLGVGAGMLDPTAAQPVEELKKYYQRNIEQNSPATTDLGRIGAAIGNPNIKLTQASALELSLIDTIQSRLRHVQSLVLAHVPDEDYIATRADFNNKQDPAAYGFDALGPKRQRQHIISLFPAASGVSKMRENELGQFLKSVRPGLYPRWDQFRQSLDWAHRYGNMNLPGITE